STPAPGGVVSDANSMIMPDGRVMQAMVNGSLKTNLIYNPITTSDTQLLWKDGWVRNPKHGSFPSDNPLLMSIIYMMIIMAIFIPLSVRKYNNAANK
ncbi:MAG: hypothetical protein RL725_189, partial [Actinomycetota bacterium]